MVYSYYPGCTLKNKAKDLDKYARDSAAALGIELQEIDEWQCCGAVYPMGKDEIATRLSSVRVLNNAKQRGHDLVTVCSACHHVIKRVNGDMQNDHDIRVNVNNYLAPDMEQEYSGETDVIHYLELLRDEIGWNELKKRVTHPLTGRKIGAYYGCMLLRPSSEMQMDNPENPTIIEDFIRAIGAEPVIYPYRNECCGGYVTIEDKAMPKKMCKRIFDSAEEKGADALITACPLCRYNLDQNGTGAMPVYYFTELLAEALGVKDADEGRRAV